MSDSSPSSEHAVKALHAADAVTPDTSTLEAGEVSGAFALLAEMTQELADSESPTRALERAVSSIVSQVDAEAGSLWMLEPDGRELVCAACVGPSDINGVRIPVTQGIVGRSVRDNICQQVLDVAKDGDFSDAVDHQSGFTTHSLLCAPISFENEPVGAIQLVNKRVRDFRFSKRDIHVLRVLASSAALALANGRMAASLVEADRVRREVELAAEIQRNLLPQPREQSFPIYGANIPARTVSGDFFDIVPLRDGRIGFCLGDVSGKGINAALMMAKTSSLYRCLAKTIEGPGELLGILDSEICETSTRGMFVTMVAGVLEPASGAVRLANAGHEPPVCRAVDGSFISLPAEAPPLGIAPGLLEDGRYPETEVSLKGGALYVFSDGLTEACRGSGGALGPEGLKALVARFDDCSLGQRVESIVAHVSGLDLRDDITLLAVADYSCG